MGFDAQATIQSLAPTYLSPYRNRKIQAICATTFSKQACQNSPQMTLLEYSN